MSIDQIPLWVILVACMLFGIIFIISKLKLKILIVVLILMIFGIMKSA
jgi:hypothetical protein